MPLISSISAKVSYAVNDDRRPPIENRQSTIGNRQFPHSSLLSGSLGQQVKKALFDFLELSFECQVG